MVASRQDVECALLWKLVRSHGWSNEVAVQDLVDDANVQDETQGRDVARNQLATRDFITSSAEFYSKINKFYSKSRSLLTNHGRLRLQVSISATFSPSI